MYKDKVKQKEANRKAKQKQRQGMTSEGDQGMTSPGMTQGMTRPANYGQADCQCMHCKQSTVSRPNHGAYKRSHELATNEVNRVALPGDVDYKGVAEIRADLKMVHVTETWQGGKRVSGPDVVGRQFVSVGDHIG